MRVIALVVFASFFASGCASSLKTFNAKGESSVGIPIGTPVLVRITEETTYEVAPGDESSKYKDYCKSDVNSKYEFLALGERSYIAFDPAPLGKGEFKIEFNDAGVLKTVSLNSDATAGTEKTTGLLETVLPYLAAPKPTASAQALSSDTTAQDKKDKHCIKKGTRVTSVEPLEIKPVKETLTYRD